MDLGLSLNIRKCEIVSSNMTTCLLVVLPGAQLITTFVQQTQSNSGTSVVVTPNKHSYCILQLVMIHVFWVSNWQSGVWG